MNNQYDIVSISIKTKPRNERRSLLSRLMMQLWLLVNIQSLLLKSEMLASSIAQEANGTKVEEIVVTLNMQHRVNTNNKTTEEQ